VLGLLSLGGEGYHMTNKHSCHRATLPPETIPEVTSFEDTIKDVILSFKSSTY